MCLCYVSLPGEIKCIYFPQMTIKLIHSLIKNVVMFEREKYPAED